MTNVQQNARYNGTKQAGNTVQFFDEMKHIIAVNDGKRESGTLVVNCHDQQAPFDFNEKTDINITSPNWDITNIRKGFLTARLRFEAYITGLTAGNTWNDTDTLAKVFVGYKAASQSVREMSIWHNNQQTNYHSKYLVQEGFTFGAFRPWTSRDKKRYIHTLYENAVAYMPDVCGTYLNLKDFFDDSGNLRPQSFKIEINIPLVDFLALQCFNKWHKAFGELFLEIYFAEHSLVVCTCSPQDVMDNKIYLETDNVSTTTLAGDANKFSHRFTQVGDPFESFKTVPYATATTTFTTGIVTVFVAQGHCEELVSTVRGYKISQAAFDAIIQKCISEPLVIPAQELRYYAFPTGPDTNGIHTNLQVPYKNITCACVVFPKTSHQVTVFENPMLQQLQLKVDGDFIPNRAYTTTGPRFLQEQLILTDLDGNLQATKEYTESIVNMRNDPKGGARWANSLGDDTSFISIFSTERGDGGYVFDGKDTNGQNVNTELNGSPQFTGENDTYYYPATDANNNILPNIHPPAPQLWLCQDTFWTFDGKVFQYFNDRNPHGSQWDGSGERPGKQNA
jgi:hypothetical protein